MVIAFMTLYLTQSLHFSLIQAGVAMLTWGVGAIAGGFLGGWLSDRIGFYPVQMGALVGGGILFLILGNLTSYPAICACTFVLSSINDCLRPANSAAIAHYSTEETRTRSFSLQRLAMNLGWAFGASLGGFIAAHNYSFLFWVDGITNIGGAILLWLVLSPSKNAATPKHERKLPTGPVQSAWKDWPYLLFIACCILFSYCFFQVFTTLPVYYKEGLHLDENKIGVIMALNGIIIACTEMVLVYRLENKPWQARIIASGTLLAGLSFIIFNLMPAGLAVALVSMLLVTVGEMLSMPFMNAFWINRSTNENRGQYAGLYSSAWAVAQVLGPWSGTLIAEKMGFSALWWWVGGLCLLSALGFLKILNTSTFKKPFADYKAAE